MSISQVPVCPGGTLYSIRSGDTLYAIAGRYDTTVSALLAANPGINPNNLQVGQVICVPGAPGPALCLGGTVYTIQPGDTLFAIAQRFGVTLQALFAANPGIDPLRLQAGQTICIPGIAPPVPFAPCCFILHPVQQFPLTQVPFPPAGVLLLQDAGRGFTAATIAASGLPDPQVFGAFDTYQGRIGIPAPAPVSIAIDLAPARAFEQPAVWAGSRATDAVLTDGTIVTVSPFNVGTGVAGDPILRGAAGACR